MSANRFNVNETREPLSRGDLRGDLLGKKWDELNDESERYSLIYQNHFDYLCDIVSNLFVWNGLPKSIRGNRIRSSFIEWLLAFYGKITCYDSDEFGIIFSPCTVVGTMDLWGEPYKVQLVPPYGEYDYSVLNKMINLDEENAVFMRNDNECLGFQLLITQVSENLTTTYMSMMHNIGQQKFPIVLTGDKESKLTMDIIGNKIDSYEKYIFIKDNGKFNAPDRKIWNKDMPYVGDRLYQSYVDILNNFFQRIGINQIPNAKKERMLVDEVNANNQATQLAGDVFLNNRQEACESINEKMGLNLSVERNVDFIDSLKNIQVDDLTNIQGGWY